MTSLGGLKPLGESMKGEVLNYDDNSGAGQISGADGIRYSFTRADLKQLVPIGRGTRVDFDFEGKLAKDIYVESPAASAIASAMTPAASTPYSGPIEPDLGLWGYFVRAYTAKFVSFTGRARRKEFWGAALFSAIISTVLTIVLFIGLGSGLVQLSQLGRNPTTAEVMSAIGSPLFWVGAVLLGIWGLITILPSIGLMVRRLHDIGQTGWWTLAVIIVAAIPGISLVSTIAIVVVGCLKSQPGENKYGPPVA